MFSKKMTGVALAGAAGLMMLTLGVQAVWAHCDAMDGPVVTEARQALAEGEVEPLVKWVNPEQEAELRAAFERTMEVREQGGAARDLADRYFFNTLVRLHRVSEGAPFTGLKPAGAPVPDEIEAADRALKSGEGENLADKIAERARQGVLQRYQRVQRLEKEADESVEAGREYVAAYVDYIHFVKHLNDQATKPVPQAEKLGSAEGQQDSQHE